MAKGGDSDMASTEYVRHHVFVEILDDYLWVAQDYAGELYFPLRPSCAALEIDSRTALATIKADSRLAPGLRSILLPTSGGEQAQQCVRSEEYGWWLALIDPRRFKPERRGLLEQRQRMLMRLAREIIVKGRDLKELRPTNTAQSADVNATGQIEGTMRCLNCGAPHLIVIDGSGWHAHLSTSWSRE